MKNHFADSSASVDSCDGVEAARSEPSHLAAIADLLGATLGGSSLHCGEKRRNQTSDRESGVATRPASGGSSEPVIHVPSTVGRFRLGPKLGSGGFGTVHRATDTVLHRDVAIKVVPNRPGSKNASSYAEARAAAKLNHPALVPLYEVLRDEANVYLVSELCDGPDLAK